MGEQKAAYTEPWEMLLFNDIEGQVMTVKDIEWREQKQKKKTRRLGYTKCSGKIMFEKERTGNCSEGS